MRRFTALVTTPLILSALLVAVTGTQAKAYDDPPYWGCTGYLQVAVKQAGPTEFSMAANVCHEFISQSGGVHSWKAVAWLVCLRNNQPFGAGTGGCKATGGIRNKRNGTLLTEFDWWKPADFEGGDFWQDSGKILGYTGSGASGDWLNAVVGSGYGNACFRGLDGVDYGCVSWWRSITSWGHYAQIH